jgi:hypothetical protein
MGHPAKRWGAGFWGTRKYKRAAAPSKAAALLFGAVKNTEAVN